MYAQSLIRASAPPTFYLITTFRGVLFFKQIKIGLPSHFRGSRQGTLRLNVKTRVKYTEHYVRVARHCIRKVQLDCQQALSFLTRDIKKKTGRIPFLFISLICIILTFPLARRISGTKIDLS